MDFWRRDFCSAGGAWSCHGGSVKPLQFERPDILGIRRWEHWHLDQSIGTSKTNFYVAWSSRHRHVYFLERAIFPFVVRHDTHYHAQYDWDVRHVCTVECGCGCGGGGGVMVFSANFACGTSKQCVSNVKGSGYGANLLPVEFV